jgi:hypothetical protein
MHAGDEAHKWFLLESVMSCQSLEKAELTAPCRPSSMSAPYCSCRRQACVTTPPAADRGREASIQSSLSDLMLAAPTSSVGITLGLELELETRPA